MRKLAIAIATLGFGAGLIAASPAATAAPVSEDYVAKVAGITLYEHDNFRGHSRTFTASDLNLSNNNWSGTSINMNDETSSQHNARNASVWLWQHANRGGTVYRADATSGDGDLSNNPIGDNSVSAVEF